MPFRSQAQRSYLYAAHPDIAKRWAKETPKGLLPPKVEAASSSLAKKYLRSKEK